MTERKRRCSHCKGEGYVHAGHEVSDVLCGSLPDGKQSCNSCSGWGWYPPPANEELLEAIAAWQESGIVHPLTCGKDSGHPNLLGAERGGSVVLVCARCDYVQLFIPDAVVALTAMSARERKIRLHDGS
ncbi:MAG TPA: hypothetical protein VD862_01580 [Candidatus Paceibacterota bacterium]|nr:hypothetical protein [Candidatus Paceibacterota bacterium]